MHASTGTGEFEWMRFDRLFSSSKKEMPAQSARYFLEMSFSDELKRRVDELSGRARSGELSASERDELSSLNNLGHVLAFVKSGARRSLKRRAAAST